MVDVDVRILSQLKEELAWAVGKGLQVIQYLFGVVALLHVQLAIVDIILQT